MKSTPSKKNAPNEQLSLRYIERALEAILRFEHAELQRILDSSSKKFGSPAVLYRVIAPLIEEIGNGWRGGTLRIAHEHFATNRLTDFLNALAQNGAREANPPLLLLATPSGQLHELGAILAAAVARTAGWRTTYLGAALPADLLRAVEHSRPQALALSIVYPPSDSTLRRDLRKLCPLLPATCPLLVGGGSAEAYRDLLQTLGATYVPQLREFVSVLDRLRPGKKRRARRRSSK